MALLNIILEEFRCLGYGPGLGQVPAINFRPQFSCSSPDVSCTAATFTCAEYAKRSLLYVDETQTLQTS